MVMQVSQDVFPFPVKAVMEYLAGLPVESYRNMLRVVNARDGQRYLLLSLPDDVLEGILSCPAKFREGTEFLGMDFDAPAHDLSKLVEGIDGKIRASVADMGDLEWLLDSGKADHGKQSVWSMVTRPARLETAQQVGRLSADTEGVLLLVREHRDMEFTVPLRKRLMDRLTDPLELNMDPVEAEALVKRAISQEVSKKFIAFVRDVAVERSRIGVMLTLARALRPVLERHPERKHGAHYLRLILDMHDTVLRDPYGYPLDAGFGEGGLEQELQKLKFYNKLPMWFESRGALGREDGEESAVDLVSYSVRVGGENPRTGNLAMVDNILQAASDPDRAYMPAMLMYAIVFDPECAAPTFTQGYTKAMDRGWPEILKSWVYKDPRSGRLALRPPMLKRVHDILRKIRADIFWALRRTADNPLGDQLLRAKNSDLSADVLVQVDAALMSRDLESGIVDAGNRQSNALWAHWLRHVRVNDPRAHPDDEWFRLRISATPEVRFLRSEKASTVTSMRRGPMESERVMRVMTYSSALGSESSTRHLLRCMTTDREVRVLVPAYFVSETRPKPEYLVGYFANAWLAEMLLRALFRRLKEQGIQNLRMDLLRLQEGGRDDARSQRMYGFGHLLEHRLSSRVPVFQQGLDGDTQKNQKNKKYRIDRTNAMAAHVWPLEVGLPLAEPVGLVHLARFAQEKQKSVQALARAYLAQPTESGFRYGHYRTWSRSSRDQSQGSVFAPSWVLSSALKGLKSAGVRRVLLVVSADAWMREWAGFEQEALRELQAVQDVCENLLGDGTIAVPLAWRRHLLLIRQETEANEPRVLDGIDALSGVLSQSLTEVSRQRIYACQGFATLRTVGDKWPQRAIMAYGFLHKDSLEVHANQEAARHAALAKSGWVHHVLLAHHACAYEKMWVSEGNICPMPKDPPIRLDPYTMAELSDRGCERFDVNGKRKLTVDWLSLLTTLDMQTARVTVRRKPEEPHVAA
jgi:hypothetical protein